MKCQQFAKAYLVNDNYHYIFQAKHSVKKDLSKVPGFCTLQKWIILKDCVTCFRIFKSLMPKPKKSHKIISVYQTGKYLLMGNFKIKEHDAGNNVKFTPI